MSLNNIIGLSGTKGSGKSVVATYLINKHKYLEYAFANPLKDALGSIFQFSTNQLYGDKKEEIDNYWGVSPRELMQRVGTDLFRKNLGKVCPDFGESDDIWVRCFERWIINQENKNIVVSDIRFENEAKKIKDLGGKIININRNTSKNNYSKHESENNNIIMKYVDYHIYNNSSIDDLYSRIENMIKKI